MTARRTALAGLLMIVTRLVTRLIDLASLLVIARLLSPADFGLVAIAVGLVTVVESTLALPLNQALLRVEQIESRHYHTAFTLGALRCIIVYLLVAAVSWPLALWYKDERLAPLVLVLGLGAIARGLANPRLVAFQKAMSYWRDASLELSGKLAGSGIAIVLACITHSYWTIAVAAVTGPVATLVLSYLMAPYRPRYSLAHVPLFSNFLGWFTLAQMIMTLNWQSERLMLGRLIPTAQLGLFTTASDLSLVPIQALLSPIMTPLLAAFQAVKADRTRVARSYRFATRAVLTLGVPIVIGESLLAEPLVRIVLGDRWAGVAPLLRMLAPSILPALFVLPSISLVTAFGEARDLVWRNLCEVLTKLPLLLLGYLAFGISAVALARIGSETVAAVVCMRVVRRMVGVSIRDQIADAGPCCMAAGAMAAAIAMLRSGLAAAPFWLDPWRDVALSVSVGAAVYAATLYVLWTINGRPAGVEATIVGIVTAFLARLRDGPWARDRKAEIG